MAPVLTKAGVSRLVNVGFGEAFTLVDGEDNRTLGLVGAALSLKLSGHGPSLEQGTLKRIGGSASDDWNSTLANQTVQSLWTHHDSDKMRGQKFNGAVAALVGIGPKDELEGMIVAHNAAMECYRRAMIPCYPYRTIIYEQRQTFVG